MSAALKFREVVRSSENPTKLLAEGLTHLAKAVSDLGQQLAAIERDRG